MDKRAQSPGLRAGRKPMRMPEARGAGGQRPRSDFSCSLSRPRYRQARTAMTIFIYSGMFSIVGALSHDLSFLRCRSYVLSQVPL
jgi:hypothetical protein